MGERTQPILDFPTAWAIQHEVGAQLDHHERCSSSEGLLCDCGAIVEEWIERRRRSGSPATEEGEASG